MKSPLDTNISCFANYDTPRNPQPVNMLQWLKSAKYANKVEQIRGIDDKDKRDAIKATLPGITPSGIFTYREQKSLVQHSGLMQFDIDAKENTHIKNYTKLKQQIKNISNVAYCGLSVSGTGFWGLVPIKYPDNHKQHFRALRKAFKNVGLVIDNAPQNVASLRGYSYDPDGYFNHEAEVFEYLEKKRRPTPTNFQPSYNGTDTRAKVEQLISKINTDITAGYDNWLKLGFAIEDEFGESGRDYFHAISQYHSDYNRRECDRQYTHCLKHRGSGIGIGTFFHVCRQHGITLKNNLNGSNGKYEAEKIAGSEKTEVDAPYGMNPYTGEVFDQRGYPSSWDDITDPMVDEISNIFDAVPINHN